MLSIRRLGLRHHAGSLPRPIKLQQAIKDYTAGKINKAALERAQDEAVKDTIERFEKTGSPIISDGEQRVRYQIPSFCFVLFLLPELR